MQRDRGVDVGEDGRVVGGGAGRHARMRRESRVREREEGRSSAWSQARVATGEWTTVGSNFPSIGVAAVKLSFIDRSRCGDPPWAVTFKFRVRLLIVSL